MEKITDNKEDLIFIKGFSKIKVADACRYFGYNQSNLTKGKSGRRAEANVRKYLERELAKLRINEIGDLECQK